MGKSPETITTRETLSYGHRMIIVQDKDKGTIFVAEYAAEYSELNFYWQVDNNPNSIKKIVEEVYEGTVEWNEEKGRLWGAVKDGDFWFNPKSSLHVARAGMEPKIIDGATTKGAFERIAELASKTITKDVVLPENLSDQLKQFVASVVSTKPGK